MPRQLTACDVRALGRLGFVVNYKSIARRLETELRACCNKATLEKAVRESGLELRTGSPRVYIITSLADGTGSGMFLDLAYMARQKLNELGHDSANVVGICYLPPTGKDPRRAGELANAFAALTELNHFSAKSAIFSAQYELGEIRGDNAQFTWEGPPFGRCRFFTLPEGHEATLTDGVDGGLGLTAGLAKTMAKAARIVFAEVTTLLGRAADEHYQNEDGGARGPSMHPRTVGIASGAGSLGRMPLYQTTGLYRLVWPRRQLLDHAARIVCRRLVQRWMSKNAKPLLDTVKKWVEERWEQDGFSAERLIGVYQQTCEASLGQPPESAFQSILKAAAAAMASRNGKGEESTPNLAAVVEAMSKLEELVGIPEECRPPVRTGETSDYQPGSLETVLQDIGSKTVDQFEQKLAELAVSVIEDPHYRLAGAEEALRQLHSQVERALQAHEQLASELQQRSAQIYSRLRTLTDNSGKSTQNTTWKPPFARRSSGGSSPGIPGMMELLRTYPKVKFQALILQRVAAMYVSLRGQLSDQLREVDFCRARLADLAGAFDEIGPAHAPRLDPPAAGRYLSSNGCKSVEEELDLLQGNVGPNELLELDHRMQTIIRGQFKALVHICMSSANVLKALVPAMHKETYAFLTTRLGETSVTDIYLQLFPSPDEADDRLEDDLADGFETASPEVVASPPIAEVNMFAVPSGTDEQRLRDAAAKAVDGKPLLNISSIDEIAVFREHTLACLADLDQMGPLAQEAYEKIVTEDKNTPHSRCDITEWGTLSPDVD
jgi:hypothetical protein